MEELLKKLLSELKEEIKSEKKEKTSKEEIIEKMNKIVKSLEESDDDEKVVICATSNVSFIYGKGINVAGVFSGLVHELKDDIPLRYLTDGFVRGATCINGEPKDLDKDKIKEILEAIDEMI